MQEGSGVQEDCFASVSLTQDLYWRDSGLGRRKCRGGISAVLPLFPGALTIGHPVGRKVSDKNKFLSLSTQQRQSGVGPTDLNLDLISHAKSNSSSYQHFHYTAHLNPITSHVELR
jgi:hypothetical protein